MDRRGNASAVSEIGVLGIVWRVSGLATQALNDRDNVIASFENLTVWPVKHCRNSRLGWPITLLFLALPLIKGRHLRPISARGHIAPPPAVILRRVIEVQYTIRALTFFEIGEVAITEQIGGGLCDRRKQLSGITEIGAETLLEALIGSHNLGVTILRFHYHVDRLDHRKLDSCASLSV
jgi:hypothetical protein